MKRFLAIFLSCVLLLTGCTPKTSSSEHTTNNIPGNASNTNIADLNFANLNDAALIEYVEDTVYTNLVYELDNEEYFVTNVSAIYVSKEYLEEAAYNSQSNIYFGYTLEELEAQFEGSKYIFTLDENGQTAVQEFETYDENEDTYDQLIKNVAIGTGVILLCVTVSAVTAAGAPAVSVIFAASAKTGTAVAVSSGLFSAVSAGIITGIQTKDFDQALEAAALSGSEGFKWGAFSGAIAGGFGEATALYGATCNGLTMNQAAAIQRESKLPLEFIKSFHSMDEYTVYKNAGLQINKVNGQWAYTQKIDWDFIGDTSDGRTNAQRVLDGLSPLDSTGKSYELHHIGQKADSPLAILTSTEHHGNYSTLHTNTGASQIDRTAFATQKREFWKTLLEMTS